MARPSPGASFRKKKYDKAQSTAVLTAQLHFDASSPTERWAMRAESRVMAKPAYASLGHSERLARAI